MTINHTAMENHRINIIACRKLFIILAVVAGNTLVTAQTTIATGLPGCLPVTSQVGVNCGGTSFFGLQGNQFVVNNIDGAVCCTPSGGDGAAYFQFATLNIANYSNVNISMAYSADSNTSYEDDSPSAPIFGCQGTSQPDNSHDQMVFMYSLNGGPFEQSLYVHGTSAASFTGTWTEGPLNGNTLTIRVYAANKAQAEIFYFQTLNITGTPTLMAGPDQTICGINPVNMQGTGTGTWSGGAGAFSNTADPEATYTPAASEAGSSVTLTYSGAPAYTGCPAPSDQMVLTINNTPQPVITIDNSSCSSVTLTASGGGAGATYQWNGGNNAGNATNTFIVSGNYIVTVTNTSNCTATAEAIVTLSSPPIASITGPTTSCGDITLTASGAGSNGTYLWNGGSNPNMAANTFSSSGTYIVTVTDANGCTATSSQAITVSTPPAVSISGNTTGCNSVTLTASGGGTGGTYAWSGGNNAGNAVNTFTMSGTYTVTVTNSSGCTATSSATVTVNQGPAGTLSGSAVLCPGQCATFSFSFTSGSQPYTVQLTASPPGFSFSIPGVTTAQTFQVCYQGLIPGYNASTNTVSIPTFLTGTGSLTLTGISDGSGCPGTASGSFSLTLTSAPTANPASLTLCETANGQATFNLTTLNSTITGGGSGLTVNWFQDMAGTIPISNPSAYTTGTTTVYAQVSNGGCTSPLVPVTLTVDPSAVPLINMLCASSGTAACEECLTGNTTELQFIFGDSRNYTVTVRNTTTNTLTTGIVSNGVNLSVPITTTTSFVIESIQPVPGCPNTATFSFMVTVVIVLPPDLDPISPPPTCNEFILPVITGTNLSGNQGYFTGPGGTGTQYFPGQSVTMSLTLYIFDEKLGCEDEETLNIVIQPPITFDQLQDLAGCESVVLPAITGPGVSSSAYYNTAQDGTGTTYQPGAIVTQSLTLFAIDPQADPACVTNVLELEVTIHPLPAPADVSIDCGGGNGNGIVTINSPTGIEYSYSIDGLPFQSANQFSGLNNGSHIITIKNTVTDCQRETSFQVSCDCATPAVINLSPVSGAVCEGEIFTSGQMTYSGNTNQVTLSSSNGAGTLSPLVVNSSPFTFTYLAAPADLGKTILINLETNDPDGPGPCAPEQRTFSLTIRNNPTGAISGPTVVCKSSPVTLAAQGGVTYTWSANGGAQPTATFAKVDSTTTYSVTVTDAFGCKDDAAFTVSTTSATAGRDSTAAYCNSSPQTINLFTFLSSGATTTGIWKLGNDTIKVPTSYVVTSLPLGVNTLRYIINDPICGKDTSVLRLEIRSKNNAGIDSQFFLCGGTLTEFDFDSSLGIHDSNGQWIQGQGTSLSFTDPSAVDVTSLKPGQYTFTYFVAGNGCDPDSATVRLSISPFVSAGPDVNKDACAGSTVDFRALLPGFFSNGTILNPNNYPGLNGTSWNTAGLAQGTYSFIYQVSNVAPCQADEALIFIDLLPSLNPGQGKTISSCQGEVIDLTSLLSADADQGGVFYLNGVKLISAFLTIPTGNSPLTIQYEVGDDISCPKKRANFTINPVIRPTVQMSAIAPICDGACQSLSLSNSGNTAATYFLSSVQQGGGLSFSTTLTTTTQGQSVTQLCASSTPPYSFVRLPVSSVFNIKVDSIEVQGCRYPDGSTTQVTLKPLNTRSFTRTICKTETIKIGNDIYSFAKPTGQTRIVSQNPQACDTLVNVQLQFFPDAVGSFTETFCDEGKTVTLGGQVFSKSRPAGTVTLQNASSRGCDSLVNVALFFEKETIPGSFSLTTCDLSYQLKLGNAIFSAANPSGSALLVGAAREGCDSLVQVNLIFEEFSAQTSLAYSCETLGAAWSIANPSHTGPFTIVVDAGSPLVVPALPYKLSLSPGNHSVKITGAGGCAKVYQIVVDDTSPPQVTVTQAPLADGSIQLTAVDNPQGSVYNISWTPSSGLSCLSCLTPTVNPQETTTYTMSYLYGTDCAGSQQITVTRINTTVVIPNIFTPDGDGRNDVFFIPLPGGVTGTVKEMAIYDRWGNRVFFTENVPANDPAEGWRGTYQGQQVVPGVYVYRIILQVSGKASDDVFAGSVAVVK